MNKKGSSINIQRENPYRVLVLRILELLFWHILPGLNAIDVQRFLKEEDISSHPGRFIPLEGKEGITLSAFGTSEFSFILPRLVIVSSCL